MANKRRNNDDKRERILKAATQVFAKHGFYKSKISVIAKLANVADGTIYLYFKNKDD
ncbi:MAG: TetR/AcrR family transcriptional regulator [bacterium]|nr:TetR/AcrR family transcriptional regulator [bacterium]